MEEIAKWKRILKLFEDAPYNSRILGYEGRTLALETVKGIPEFEDLIKEEQEIMAAGASKEEIREYGGLYKKAFARKERIEYEIRDKFRSILLE